MFLLKKNNTLEKSHGSSWCIFFSPYPYSLFDLCLRLSQLFWTCECVHSDLVCVGLHSCFSTIEILCLVVFLWLLIYNSNISFGIYIEWFSPAIWREWESLLRWVTILPQDFCVCQGVCWTSDQEESVMCFPPFSRSSCRFSSGTTQMLLQES